MSEMYKAKRMGDNEHPWRSPRLRNTGLVMIPFTEASTQSPEYIACRDFRKVPPIPMLASFVHSISRSYASHVIRLRDVDVGKVYILPLSLSLPENSIQDEIVVGHPPFLAEPILLLS
jgi:hypothetical protein